MLLCTLTIVTTGYVWHRVDAEHFQTVMPGKVYRSGQMTEEA
jgi:hypothetical protein